jgi:DNA repair exonuclease SbcCD ATPase subunit
LKRLLEKKGPLIPSDLWQEIEKLKERNRQLHLKIGASRRENIEKISELEQMNQAKQAQLAELQAQLAAVQADREELAQLKKEAKEAAAEIHREGRSIELEKVRWQQQLSDARAELADAKATILKQGDKIRELERGYSFKPNPAESALRLEIGNLQAELEAYKQQQPTTELELLEPADLLNQLKAQRKKSTATLADVEKILEILEEGSNEPD